MTNHHKRLELTFKSSRGQVSKSRVSHFLDDLDPIIFAEQLSRIPMLDTKDTTLVSQRLCQSHCLKVDRIDTTRIKIMNINQ